MRRIMVILLLLVFALPLGSCSNEQLNGSAPVTPDLTAPSQVDLVELLHGELERLGAGARQSFESLYTEEANYRMLMEIYQQAIEVSQQRGIS